MTIGRGIITFSRISSERHVHPDPVVNALGRLGWVDGEPMNVCDEAEEIVTIVRQAIEDRAPVIDWRPISELPEDAADGRQFLFWWDDEAVIAAYNDTFHGWYIPYYEMGSVDLPDFSHFAEISAPKTN